MSTTPPSEPTPPLLLTPESIRAMRRSYGERGLEQGDLPEDPLEAIQLWLGEASVNPLVVEANAMVLATSNGGLPGQRTVLLKGIDERGLSFFSNYRSRKAADLHANPRASLLFPWYPMERQVIVEGAVTRLSREESAEYFALRPWGSQIAARASEQSQPIDSREVLEERWRETAAEFPEGSTVPLPDWWGGYLLEPTAIEFWQGRYSRLHDRLRFERKSNGDHREWRCQRLSP
jgi:pyridoxamine 5'-phosphate oxidase